VFIGIQSHLNQTPMCIYNKNIPISDDNPKTSFDFILDDSFFLVLSKGIFQD
jgi:hypothetical protein